MYDTTIATFKGILRLLVAPASRSSKQTLAEKGIIFWYGIHYRLDISYVHACAWILWSGSGCGCFVT